MLMINAMACDEALTKSRDRSWKYVEHIIAATVECNSEEILPDMFELFLDLVNPVLR